MVVQPLDIETILIGYFSGTLEIFAFISFIFLSILAAKFKMPGDVFLLLLGAYVGVLSFKWNILLIPTMIIIAIYFTIQFIKWKQ